MSGTGERLDGRLERLNAKVDRLSAKLERIEAKLDAHDASNQARFEQLQQTMMTHLSITLEALDGARRETYSQA